MGSANDLADYVKSEIDDYIDTLSEPKGQNIDRQELFRTMWGALWDYFAGDSGVSGNVGGEPIIEVGENSNGHWIRYPEGTQICWWKEASRGNTRSGDPYEYSITFPKEFASVDISVNPARWGTGRSYDTASSEPHVLDLTTTGFVWAIHDNGSTFGIHYTAIGRWK
jgi:hypothetical protein